MVRLGLTTLRRAPFEGQWLAELGRDRKRLVIDAIEAANAKQLEVDPSPEGQ